jgi:phosphatidylserine decarboxylase
VNRYPVSGDIDHRTYNVGRFEPAWRKSASHGNERASTGIRGGTASVLVRQIAGLAAKRIVTYATIGDRVQQGERMGLIRFGSRVDLFLPASSNISVEIGQRAVGGVTVIADLAQPSQGATQ